MNEATTLIGGTWRKLDSRREVTDPASGDLVGTVCWGSAKEAEEAADAAEKAFLSWANTTGRERADLLASATENILSRKQEIARLLAAEAGKRLPEAEGELGFSAEYFRWFAEEARRPVGQVYSGESPARRHLSTRMPAGVVATLTSWNFPCSLQARKIAPALAAGCTVIIRVSERAPLAATELVRAVNDAGFPPGVINIVHGPAREISDAYLDHNSVRVVSFTGSTNVGRQVMKNAADRIVRPLLELGGDAPFIVFDDADLDKAVDDALIAKTRNTGQSCVAANRFIVHEKIHDEFVQRLSKRLDALSMGSGLTDPVPDLGPMIDAHAAAAAHDIADEARELGAIEATQSRSVPAQGAFVRPMLFTNVPDESRLASEEVFAPIAGVFPFSDEDEAISRANNTEMGLASYVFSRDVERCWRVADRLQAGIVGINDPVPSVAFAPMGGAKQSGLGREGESVGLEEFTEPKYYAWRF